MEDFPTYSKRIPIWVFLSIFAIDPFLASSPAGSPCASRCEASCDSDGAEPDSEACAANAQWPIQNTRNLKSYPDFLSIFVDLSNLV